MGITVESAMKKKSPKIKKRFKGATGSSDSAAKPKKGLSAGAMWTIGALVTGVIIGVVVFLKKRGSLMPKTGSIDTDVI